MICKQLHFSLHVLKNNLTEVISLLQLISHVWIFINNKQLDMTKAKFKHLFTKSFFLQDKFNKQDHIKKKMKKMKNAIFL